MSYFSKFWFATVLLCGQHRAHKIAMLIENLRGAAGGGHSLAYGERLEAECNIKKYSKVARRNTLNLE